MKPMKQRLLLILVLFFSVAAPVVNGQVEVSEHDITFELRSAEVHVEEVIVFENPATSEIHTFDGSISLLRGNVEGFSVKGTDWTLNNDSFPTLVKLDFSRSPIYRSAAQNTRKVILSYDTPDFTRELQLDGRKVYVFAGNLLIPLPLGLSFKDTNIEINLAEGLWFGESRPTGDMGMANLYSFAQEKRLSAGEFNVEVEYGDYSSYALADIKKTDALLADAKKNAADAEEAIANVELYGIDAAKANSYLSRAMELIKGAESYLQAANALLQTDDPYKAYLASNNSVTFAKEADLFAQSAEKEANVQLRLSLNERISQLENMTSMITPPSTILPDVQDGNQTPKTPPATTGPRETGIPKEQTDEPSKSWFYSAIPYLVLILAVVGLSIYVSKTQQKRKRKFGAVRDFRAISDLKRKSYRDFEEKVLDVKKETTIAGDIRSLNKEKAKYELGIENLNKRKIAGELTDETYNLEKQRFLETIKGLDKQIEMLEKELPKGAKDEKSVTDKPGKGI